jgi:hypothetical protein
MNDNQVASDAWTCVLPVKPPELTEDQWQIFASGSGLPEAIRPRITAAIAFYQIANRTRLSSRTPAETKKLLAETAKRATDLQNLLAGVAQNPLAALGSALAQNRGSIGRTDPDITRAARAIGELSDWMNLASKRVAGGNSGAHLRSVQINLTISLLNRIYQEFKGRPLSRTQKAKKGEKTPIEFVQAFFQIADPSVGRSSIDEALKRLSQTREIAKKLDR